MRIGWLVDRASYIGGAERTQDEFRAAAPDGIEIIDCPVGNVDPDCDRYAIHNCVSYALDDLKVTKGKPTVKYWNDIGSWLKPGMREFLDRHATPICCSPLQQDHMGFSKAHLIPPAVDLDPFRQAASRTNGNRSGAISVGSWRNLGKAPHMVVEWGARNGGVEFFGDGPFAPQGSRNVDYRSLPILMASYETFVFLPNVIEPFGRAVVEAWAAGCGLVINNLVGSKWWIMAKPDALETAAEDFWAVVLDG